jgi:hypothetical protein
VRRVVRDLIAAAPEPDFVPTQPIRRQCDAIDSRFAAGEDGIERLSGE